MPSKRAAKCANTYVQAVKSILACITRNHLLRTTVAFETGYRYGLLLARDPFPLVGSRFSFGFWQFFAVFYDGQLGCWRTRVEQYKYQILDAEAHEILAFHWNPLENVSLPHLHLGFGVQRYNLPFDNKAHIPTGRVPLADVARFLISELKVEPLVRDWEEQLDVARQDIADAES